MAVQPPPGPVNTQLPPPVNTPAPPPVNPQLPPPVKTGRSCFGCGCGGCLLAIVLVLLLVFGGGYYFFVVQAQAAVPSPAAVLVISTPVDVETNNSAGFHTARPGQEVNAGDSVRTGDQGHASIQFPDGTRQPASLVQRVGRTFTNVQHLVGGATFTVGGHSVNASVRGTQFEVLVRADHTILIMVFAGTVKVSGTTTASVTAGQQIDADANGRLSGQGPIQPENADPYTLDAQCARVVSAGTNPGSVQTSTGEGLATGQTAEIDYSSPGGTLNFALYYPGNLMTLTVIDPNGVSTSPGKPRGRFRAPSVGRRAAIGRSCEQRLSLAGRRGRCHLHPRAPAARRALTPVGSSVRPSPTVKSRRRSPIRG